MKPETLAILAGIGVLTLWAVLRNTTAQGVGVAVGGAIVDTGTGLVLGIGDAVGLPRTNETECQRALREGRTWDASFACPAATFIKSFF